VTQDPIRISRRTFAKGLALGLTGGFAGPALANDFGSQAEWAPRFDADGRVGVPRAVTPLLSSQTVAATEQAIEQYRRYVAQGGWGAVPTGQTLKLGVRSPNVIALRQRLIYTGDLDPAADSSPVFDSFVEASVRRFQVRHGLNGTGVAAKQTFQAMNAPATERLRQLELNLVRLRAFSGNLGHRHVTMNIPAAAIETVEGGQIVTHHTAGVGKIDRQSPVMQARALSVNFNPFWTVPASIIRKDLIPKMQQDANYLTENRIRIYTRGGQEIQPQQVNWNSMEATNYMFRQDPGGDVNSLGFVRIDIANPHGVYMHDTPAKGIFGDDYRFVSSGCVRVQNVRDYVAWLLREQPGWDRDRIDETIRSGQRVDVRINPSINVYWVYVTAWSGDGVVQFREDIYRRDGFGGGAVADASARVGAADDDLLPPLR
jgi:murein L,D-transpeptidase YcbB/YkuD